MTPSPRTVKPVIRATPYCTSRCVREAWFDPHSLHAPGWFGEPATYTGDNFCTVPML